VKHALTLAVALSVMLLVSTAGAVNWVTWHCPVTDGGGQPCDSVGKVHYKCQLNHEYNKPALVDADGDSLGPPREQCEFCRLSSWAYPQWARCHADGSGPHEFYPPSWQCWYGGQWWDYNYYGK